MTMKSSTDTEPATETRPMSLRQRSTSITCSARSLGSDSSRSTATSSRAASPLRRAVPAIGRMVAVRPSRRRNSSGLAPTTTRPAMGSRLMYGLGLRSRIRR